ncbi:heavy metal translocating P-type ATPase [Halocynthiibacter styelae]|uniref:Cadmium-translocating P-type ATPase n=1 Tax=Halocynthiibacter styelae TaxID=2761955 RepID=A0A8J7LLA3_9RHOB|nr:heavy metal translocating P-type ATPase [Paenihalocynthiibacter styelae]MBI1494319.1 cadmium-translocating P-type ATPase [Paenihalocynthiibacter styelae]
MADTASFSACPACDAAPIAKQIAENRMHQQGDILLSLPTIHCAGCISAVERKLLTIPGVTSARVNLSLKRVVAETGGALEAADLVEALEAIGYPAHELDSTALSSSAADKAARALLFRLGISGFAMMNVMLLSVAVWSGAEAATRDLFHWISAMIALPVIIWAAQPFFKNAWTALRAGHLNMDVPISLAIFLAGGMSLFETINGGEEAYFDAALSLTFFLLAGRYLDQRTRRAARSAAEELTALEVPRVVQLTEDGEATVPLAQIAAGDMVLVRPGARVPVDGIVTKGDSEVDRALLTGETLPVAIGVETIVSAGEINLTGPLEIRVTAAGRDSSLSRMADLVTIAEGAKNRYSSLADKAAQIYAPGVHTLAFLAFIGWLWASGGDIRFALNIAVAVLIITCPCALGLAVPAVVTAASGNLFRKGLLVKNATALERLAEVDFVVFDKTGTLTDGDVVPGALDDLSMQNQRLALALAQNSGHPLARALAQALQLRGISPATLTDIREVPGKGVQAKLNGTDVALGRAEWLGAEAGQGTATFLQCENGKVLEIPFEDHLRADAIDTIAALKSSGLPVMLLSGDNDAAVAQAAEALGIDQFHARMRPEDKAAKLKDLADQGHHVLMVGDGLNDTVALASAHVSVSPASALDAARVASDIVLLGNRLGAISDARAIARSARRRILENFAIAAGYNAISVPIALMGFASPLAAALAMSTSSILVSLNALRLRGAAQEEAQ